MFLMIELRRLDVWPIQDPAVRRGYGLAWHRDPRRRFATSAAAPTPSPTRAADGPGRHRSAARPRSPQPEAQQDLGAAPAAADAELVGEGPHQETAAPVRAGHRRRDGVCKPRRAPWATVVQHPNGRGMLGHLE